MPRALSPVVRATCTAVSMTALAFAFSTTVSAQGEDTIRFEIEAQRLSDALLDFSRQSRINVIAPTSLRRRRPLWH